MARQNKSQRALADAAYARVEAERVQIGMFTGPPPENPAEGQGEAMATLPESCPGCGKRTQRPATWTHMKWRSPSPTLQCGNCGQLVAVSQEVFDEVAADARTAFVDRDPKTWQTKNRRKERGAG